MGVGWFTRLFRGQNKNLFANDTSSGFETIFDVFACGLLVIFSLTIPFYGICLRKQRGPCETCGTLSLLISSEYSSSTLSEPL